LTQVEAANALGYLQSYISKCEQGERRVDLFELQEFAELYGVSMDALGGPVTPEEQFEAAAHRAHPDDEDYG
jgi:transcriptional regulator with XRE-family HTH domain